jgi:hypothetical protein
MCLVPRARLSALLALPPSALLREFCKIQLIRWQAIKDGKVHLLSTTTFEGSTLRFPKDANDVDIEGKSSSAETESSFTNQIKMQDEAVIGQDGQIERLVYTDTSSLTSSMTGVRSEADKPAVDTFLQTGEREQSEPGDGEWAPSAGATVVEMTFKLTLDSTTEDEETFEEAPGAFIQVPERIYIGRSTGGTRLDLKDSEVLTMFTTHASLMPIALALERAPGATVALDAKVSNWYAAREIDAVQYVRYLSMLASVHTASAEAILVAKLSDSKLQRADTQAVEDAMTSLLSKTEVPEGIYQALLDVAKTSEIESVRDTALLVLAGLLRNKSHLEGSDAMPAWCQWIFDEIISTVDAGKFRSAVNAAALGNTRWLATQPKLAAYLSHPDLFTVHLAVDGLQTHAGKLSQETEQNLVRVLTGHDWTNVSSQIPIKVIALLEHSAKVKASLGGDGTEDGGKSQGWKTDNQFPTKLNLFAVRTASEGSDYHKTNVNVGGSLSYDQKTGSMSFTLGTALEATFFKTEFTKRKGNAVVEVVWEAKTPKRGSKWEPSLAWKILGVTIKAYTKEQMNQELSAWVEKVARQGWEKLTGWTKGKEAEKVSGPIGAQSLENPAMMISIFVALG